MGKKSPRINRSSQSAGDISKPNSPLVLVENSNLVSLGTRPTLKNYLNTLWDRRHFILAQAKAKSLRTGAGTFLGRVWIILDPVTQIMMYFVVFGVILDVSRGMDNFIGFLTLGVIFFGFISRGITGGSGMIASSRNLIAAFSFPRAAIPIAAVLRMFIDNGIPALVAVTATVVFQLDKPVSWTICLAIPLYILIHIFAAGCIFIGARLTAFIPDFKTVLNLLNRALFFASGVFFTIERFSTSPMLELIVTLNPVYLLLDSVRSVVMLGGVPSLGVWVYISAWSIGIFIVGFLYFWRAEERYANAK